MVYSLTCKFNTTVHLIVDKLILKMPGCCALSCTGRSEKGVRLFLLPQGQKNQTRREKWIKNISRKDLPSYAYVCENHFTTDQFENNRADLKRPLRWDAIPTLFSCGRKSKRKQALMKRGNTTERNLTTLETRTEENSLDDPIKVSDKSDNILDRLEIVVEYPRNISKQDEPNSNDTSELKRKLNIVSREAEKLKEENAILRNQIKKIFNEDQIDVLKRGKMTGRQWQVDTIKKSLKIYLACGTRGYEELRKHNYPLPGIRTLQKQAEKFESKTLDDLFFNVVDGQEYESESKQLTMSPDEIARAMSPTSDVSPTLYLES